MPLAGIKSPYCCITPLKILNYKRKLIQADLQVSIRPSPLSFISPSPPSQHPLSKPTIFHSAISLSSIPQLPGNHHWGNSSICGPDSGGNVGQGHSSPRCEADRPAGSDLASARWSSVISSIIITISVIRNSGPISASCTLRLESHQGASGKNESHCSNSSTDACSERFV